MANAVNIRVIVLWDHEIRNMAKALDVLNRCLRSKMQENDETHKLLTDFLNAANACLGEGINDETCITITSAPKYAYQTKETKK